MTVRDTCPACNVAYADHCRTYLRIIQSLQERLNRNHTRNVNLAEQLNQRDARVEELTETFRVIQTSLNRTRTTRTRGTS